MLIAKQKIKYNAFVHPWENKNIISLLKQFDYNIVYDESAAMYGSIDGHGGPAGIRVEKETFVHFDDKEE
jgi:hypothetical protein